MTESTSTAPQSFTLDFIVVGSRKCATTWLYQLFLRHPEVCVSRDVKESGYFSRNYRLGLAWYRRLFSPSSAERVLGEVDADLLRQPESIERIGRDFPGAKVIALFRNPADLFFSSYDHALRKGDVVCSPAEAWRTINEFKNEVRFGDMMRRLQDHVSTAQLLVLTYERVESDPTAVLQEVATFLGLREPFDEGAIAERVNPARRARFPLVATAVSRGARMARKAGLHRLVQLLKQAPGASAMYVQTDRDTVRAVREGALRREILTELAPQIEAFEQRSGLSVRELWRIP